MAKGKKPHLDPPREWKINIPTSVAVSLELLLRDPITNRTKHGARSKLITRLLREYLASRTKENQS